VRNFQVLDGCKVDPTSDSIELFSSTEDDDKPRLAMRREGAYVTISASYGPLEIALRPRHEDLVRTLARLTAVDGLHTTRQVGTAQAYLAIGLTSGDHLLLRPTIVADAAGHLCLNVEITSQARESLYNWLQVTSTASTR
jgi:hypothetical protein